MTDAERNKMIARMMREGKTDQEIKAAMRSPMQSFWEGNFMKDATTAAGNVGSGLLDIMDRAYGPITAIDSGLVTAVRDKNPLSFGKGFMQNVTKPSSQQLQMSQATGSSGLQGFVQDMAVPSTFVGGGLLGKGSKVKSLLQLLKGFGR